jgi:hypothetical protein
VGNLWLLHCTAGKGQHLSFFKHRRLMALGSFGVPMTRALFESTYFAGLRKAGMPEE